jgi:carbon catabolite-derepressing protein kinase
MLTGKLPFDDENIPNLFKKISGGIFTVPSYLTADTRHLLMRMLEVDPLKRITIHGIRQTPWFQIALPDYLLPLPHLKQSIDIVDDTLIPDLVKVSLYCSFRMTEPHCLTMTIENGFEYERGQRVFGAKKYESNSHGLSIVGRPERNELESQGKWGLPKFVSRKSPGRVFFPAFQQLGRIIFYEVQRGQSLLIILKKPESRSQLSVQQPSPILTKTPSPTIRPLSLAIPGSAPNVPSTFPPRRQAKTRPKWHYGIRSKSHPLDIMVEIYTALKKCDMVRGFHCYCANPKLNVYGC